MVNYKVKTNESVTTYEGFTNQQFHGADVKIDVDSDLGVGPFFCYRDDYLKAKSEIRRYLKEQWNRNDTNVKYIRLTKRVYR